MPSKDSDAGGENTGAPAQAATASPGWVPNPTTVTDEVRILILRYGADAVKRAVKEATKAKRGPKKKPDWKELRDVIETDARDWLAGRDPFKLRTNYAIAKAFAERHPGHSPISTFERIERKLKTGPYDRRWFVFTTAEIMTRDSYPHADHLRALEALAKLPKESGSAMWKRSLERAQAEVARFEAREEHPPDASMTMEEIEEANAQAPLNALMPPSANLWGLFGNRSKK